MSDGAMVSESSRRGPFDVGRWDAAERVGVAVEPADCLVRHRALFEALEAIYPVSFGVGGRSDHSDVVAGIIFTDSPIDALATSRRYPCLAVLRRNDSASAPRARTVRFGNADAIPVAFRSRTFIERSSADVPACTLAPGAGDVVMAEQDGSPVWVRYGIENGLGASEMVSIPLPVVTRDELLIHFLDRNRFIALLPLLAFLQRVSSEGAWGAPPLRACFVFDDPNLRRGTYGCLDFRKLVDHARRHRYHAAIATIPLDASKTASEVAGIFRNYSEQVSLAIHGNNHIHLELAGPQSEHERTAVLAQAFRRMGELATRHELDVSRVMEPPYGAIRSECFSVMAALGYEAALVTNRQFDRWNRTGNHTTAFGLASVESAADGLALIPRITAAPGWETEAALAAFLGQPIVIAGHHFDAAGDFEFLDRLADVVNGMGPVIWSNLSAIARSRFVTRREGATLRVRAASRRIVVPIAGDCQSIVVERPWIVAGGRESLLFGAAGASLTVSSSLAAQSEPIAVNGAGSIEFISPAPTRLDPASVAVPPSTLWPSVRRACTELRDRCYPYVHRA